MIAALVVSGPMPAAAASKANALYDCRLFTTAKTHSGMSERHRVISAEGCGAANGRGFKECEGCKKPAAAGKEAI
ncbi:MAG: hypothetical protein EPN94_10955 [Nitrospirae bacterium]|nr:MAG: hypothetical protein EPN94_10955 [Nitrospirota bacterium]